MSTERTTPSVDDRLPAGVTREDVRERAEDAESVLEMQQWLRMDRMRARPLLRQCGVLADLTVDHDEVLLTTVAEQLDVDRDATLDEFAGGVR